MTAKHHIYLWSIPCNSIPRKRKKFKHGANLLITRLHMCCSIWQHKNLMNRYRRVRWLAHEFPLEIIPTLRWECHLQSTFLMSIICWKVSNSSHSWTEMFSNGGKFEYVIYENKTIQGFECDFNLNSFWMYTNYLLLHKMNHKCLVFHVVNYFSNDISS